MRSALTVLAPDLQVGDLIIQTGIAGIVGQVARLHVSPKYVYVRLADGSDHVLGHLEACDVERERRAEAA